MVTMNIPALPGFRLILFLYTLFAFGYSLLMPMWEAPDETAHYLVVLHLAKEGTMPTMDETYEAAQPPPYYWLVAQLLRLLGAINPELIQLYRPHLSLGDTLTRYHWTAENYRIIWGVQILRWLNIAWGGLALFFVHKGVTRFTSTAIRPDMPDHHVEAQRLLPLATVAVMGLLPQFLYNSASFSNDPPANAAGACLFWLLSVVSSTQMGIRGRVAITAAALAFPPLIKFTILPLSLTILFALLRQEWQQYRTHRAQVVVGMVLLTLFLGGCINWLWPESAILLWRSFVWRVTYIRPGAFSGWPLWNIVTFYVTSYWGQVGWKDAGLPGWSIVSLMSLAWLGWLASLRLLLPHWTPRRFWGWLFTLLILVSASGIYLYRANPWWRVPGPIILCVVGVWLLAYWRFNHSDPAYTLAFTGWSWSMVWLVAGLSLFGIIKNGLVTPQYQGRFLFPALGALSLLIITGWYTLLPPRARPYLPHIVITLHIGLNFLLWFTRVIPIYYQPFWAN